MPQSNPLYIGLDVHKASMAVADVAHAHGAVVTCLGTIGTRQGDSIGSAARYHPRRSL
jgi:hypothetical protein